LNRRPYIISRISLGIRRKGDCSSAIAVGEGSED
jgi:hypothetical protein